MRERAGRSDSGLGRTRSGLEPSGQQELIQASLKCI